MHLYTRVSDLTTGFRFLWSGDHCNLIWFKSIPTFNRTQHPTPGHYAARPVTGQGSNKHWLFHSFRAIKLTSCVGTSECNESLTLWRCCVAIVLPLFPLFRSRKLQTRPCGAAALMQPLSYCYIISEISDHENREHFQEFRLATKKNIKQRSVRPFLAEFK